MLNRDVATGIILTKSPGASTKFPAVIIIITIIIRDSYFALVLSGSKEAINF